MRLQKHFKWRRAKPLCAMCAGTKLPDHLGWASAHQSTAQDSAKASRDIEERRRVRWRRAHGVGVGVAGPDQPLAASGLVTGWGGPKGCQNGPHQVVSVDTRVHLSADEEELQAERGAIWWRWNVAWNDYQRQGRK